VTDNKTLKICLTASAGGHLSQLMKLASAWEGQNVFYVTTAQVIHQSMQQSGKVYVVGECNRQHPLRVMAVLIRCMRIVLREKPEVVISTGAASGCIMCILGKLLSAKVIWIDSITNVERLSLSGRLVRYFANLVLVQWPDLVEKNTKVEYFGAVI